LNYDGEDLGLKLSVKGTENHEIKRTKQSDTCAIPSSSKDSVQIFVEVTKGKNEINVQALDRNLLSPLQASNANLFIIMGDVIIANRTPPSAPG